MLKRKLFLVAMAAVTACGLFAAPWFSHNSRRTIHTLVVVGNYKTPRLLADTILSLTKQPHLLISNDSYFIVMPKVTQGVNESKLDVYINRLNPRRVVIIGDERFVSAATEAKLRHINLRRIPIVRIYGDDWLRIAEELDDLLNIGNLSREFERSLRDLSLRDRPLRNPEMTCGTSMDQEVKAPAASEIKAEEADTGSVKELPIDPEENESAAVEAAK